MPIWNTRSLPRNFDLTSSRGATSNSALARVDGADDTYESLPHQDHLRSTFMKLGSLKTAWTKTTPRNFLSSKQIANEIRRLSGHDKSTVYQRHRKFNDGDDSCPNFYDLLSLCERFTSYVQNATGTEDFYSAKTEFLKLCAEDPIVYELLQHCKRRIASNVLPPEPDRFETPDSRDVENCHRLWSKLLGHGSFEMIDELESSQSNCDALKRMFEYNQYAKVSVEYIHYAMALRVEHEDLDLLYQLWESFLICVSKRTRAEFWIENMDQCFKNIISTGKPLAYFVSPSLLGRIVRYLFRYASKVPFIFATFFSAPKIELQGPKYSPYGVEFVYHSPAGSWDIVTASTYAILVADVSPYLRIHYIDTFRSSVFVQSATVDLYKVGNNAMLCYRRAAGILCNGMQRENIHRTLVARLETCLKFIAIANSSGKDKKDKDIPRNNFYISHSVDVDRYHKHEILQKFNENDAYVAVLNDRLRFQTFLRNPDGICNLTYIPQFQNVSYLRRFKIGSKYFITADGLPGSSNKILSLWNRDTFSKVTIDTMLLEGHALTCLRMNRESPVFNSTGHYPLLAGFDFTTDEPLYVAVVHRGADSPWYFTTVKEGASSVSYSDEIDEEHDSRNFFVLALRHDPIDLPPQYAQIRTGAKDPTGPVYWLEFWPRKDAHYWDDERLRDDRRLASLLGDLRERKIMDGILEGFD